jgi:hypothetical protein
MTTAALVTAAAVDTGGKFTAGVVNIGGKFTAAVNTIKENLGTLVVNLPLVVYQ